VQLIIHEAAEEESVEAAVWYEERQQGLGAEFLAAVRRSMADIAGDPFRYPRYEPIRTKADIRRIQIGTFSYLAVYQIWADTAYVLSICHSARRPGYWRKRIKR
jgi:hypothetical protein